MIFWHTKRAPVFTLADILADPQRAKNYTEQQYLRTAAEMADLFADIPEALANSVAIAQRCNVKLNLGEVHLPKFPLPDENIPIADYFAREARQGLQRRFQNEGERELLPLAIPHRVRKFPSVGTFEERLQQELSVINRMGFAGYFLIVADFITLGERTGYSCRPGPRFGCWFFSGIRVRDYRTGSITA